MCGRFFLDADSGDAKMCAVLSAMEKKYPGEYKTGEAFPGDAVPAIIAQQGRIVAVPAIFGFPGFQDKRLLINARSETAAEKKTFANSLRERRIVLPASGFYEWSHNANKTKFYFSVDDWPTLYICGIYELIEGQYRFVVLTREANASMIETHHRMPVIISENEVRAYLTDYKKAMGLITDTAPDLTREET